MMFVESLSQFLHQDKSAEATLVNLLGMSIVLFCIIVVGIAAKQSFKRLHRCLNILHLLFYYLKRHSDWLKLC